MEAGERELRKAFEETTTRNVKTNIEFSQSTRKLVRELEKKVEHLENYIRSQNEIINNLRIQIASIQTKIYSGGTE